MGMTKNLEEKLVVWAGALGLLVLGYRAVRLLWIGAVLTRKKLAKSRDDNTQGA